MSEFKYIFMLILCIVAAFVIHTQIMHNEAVKHHAGQFNSMTDDFEWLDVAKPKEK